MRLMLCVLSAVVGAEAAVACDPGVGGPLNQSDPEFVQAVEDFYNDSFPTPLKVATFATLLRTNEPIFSAMVREGKASKFEDIRNAAVFCEMMNAQGFVVSVSADTLDLADVTQPQRDQLRNTVLNLSITGRDFEAGCVSTYRYSQPGCHPTYFVSFSEGIVSFRNDTQSGDFQFNDGKYTGQINLNSGGTIYQLPARLVMQ